jgi:phosphoserine phosphatase
MVEAVPLVFSVAMPARWLRRVGLLCGAFAGVAGLPAAAPEPHAAAILRELVATRDAIIAERRHAPGQAVFLAFWDLDGTLLKGDCSEGLVEAGKTVYPGLAQLGIERGLVATYRPAGGFAEFWQDYEYLDRRVGHWLAYPFIPQMFRGALAADVAALAREHFGAVLHRYYYAGSLEVLRGLESAGVENHVISASAGLFVRGAAPTLGLPEERLHGIVVRTDAAGRLTGDLVPPITWAEGKRAKLLEIVAAAHEAHPGAEVYVLAAFGNSYGTDGAFLEYTARQTLPAGRRGLAVMINGGAAPERYRGYFREVTQAATVD